MRIRKNSRLISSSSTASLLVCQLNRSPWDIDSTTQDGSDVGSFTRNGSMGGSSRYSGESMELSFEYMPPQSKQESIKDEIGSLDDGSGLKHFTLSDSTTKTIKKKAGGAVPPVPPAAPPPGSRPKRRGRPRKVVEGMCGTTTAMVANQYEFYYYSGFGPRWGKKRGDNENEDNGRKSHNVSEDEDELENSKKNNYNEDDDDDSGKKKGYIENVIDEELDYIEDDDDEEEEIYGGRRARKPIKARSLKSLM